MKLLKSFAAVALFGIIAASCGKKESTESTDTTTVDTTATTEVAVMEPNIVEVASGNENFTTLVAAVTAAGLGETLSGEGPFTVFAPTNDAFAKLPAGTVETLLKPENIEKLKSILTYHVVSGKFDAATVIDAIKSNNNKYTVTTVQGAKIDLSLKDDKVLLTDATGAMSTVVMPDVQASNGIIHAIDAVVMPTK
ncbi:fasciclin domain-containing protein [Flavobacterium tegetincola]|uniref:fasciclin domain-containing protein n=1 Tax=Flavobacterium tegetincola TaxID=150172 RepID=UPI00040D1C55|nr:fasciclin domain-containing protein [Flavobacterium tegetincola]